jgi:hypothetical protein
MSNMGIFANGRQPFELGTGGGATSAVTASGEDSRRGGLPTPAGRSQSFNEAQSVMRREAIINRPLPSPPIERYNQVRTVGDATRGHHQPPPNQPAH